jgi:hypothetical protein
MTVMQTDAKETRSGLEVRYTNELTRFDKSILDMKNDAKDRQVMLSEGYDKQIEELKMSSKSQVASIVSETRIAATEQTQKEIAAILQTDRVQKIIEQNAIGELKDKLPTVMAAYMRDLPQILEAASWFDNGVPEGEAKLKDLMRSDSEFTKAISSKLYDKIVKKQETYTDTLSDRSYNEALKNIGVTSPLHAIVYNKYPTNTTDIKNLEALVRVIKNVNNEYGYYVIGPATRALSMLAEKRLTCIITKKLLNGITDSQGNSTPCLESEPVKPTQKVKLVANKAKGLGRESVQRDCRVSGTNNWRCA